MNDLRIPQLTYQGDIIDMNSVGELRRSIDVINERD